VFDGAPVLDRIILKSDADKGLRALAIRDVCTPPWTMKTTISEGPGHVYRWVNTSGRKYEIAGTLFHTPLHIAHRLVIGSTARLGAVQNPLDLD
jgi:hypothetical protein